MCAPSSAIAYFSWKLVVPVGVVGYTESASRDGLAPMCFVTKVFELTTEGSNIVGSVEVRATLDFRYGELGNS